MAFTIKQNDTSPGMLYTLENESGAVNLTSATVRFLMSTGLAATATVEDALTGQVSYAWQTGDTVTSGTHNAEFEVTYSDGSIETFPNDGYIEVKISPDLG